VLRASGWIHDDERVVLFNTGNALSYAHLWAGEDDVRVVEKRSP
jgi:hypothetical protein